MTCDRLYLNNLKNQQQRISLRLMYQQTEGHLKKHVQNLQRLLRIIWIPSDQQEVFFKHRWLIIFMEKFVFHFSLMSSFSSVCVLLSVHGLQGRLQSVTAEEI